MPSKERPACQTCGLFRKALTPFMPPEVPEGWDGRLLIVGERPGQHEDGVTGRPFTGPSGQRLRRIVERLGVRPALTNAVRCGGPDNARPTMAQVRACRPVLLRTIAELRPEVVVLAGETAVRSALNNGSVKVAAVRGRNLREIAFLPPLPAKKRGRRHDGAASQNDTQEPSRE
ncbi:MAG: uracil-DNA glycosylase family protein [Armatimonadota bacterium]|nr:uracil-DNA glycosylase family protein [Armatimonadota bacterium]